jgi:hypothetical protein
VLVSAIAQGARMYAKGDIKGCAALYRQAADSAMGLPSATENERMRLRAGLQGAAGKYFSKSFLVRLFGTYTGVMTLKNVWQSVHQTMPQHGLLGKHLMTCSLATLACQGCTACPAILCTIASKHSSPRMRERDCQTATFCNPLTTTQCISTGSKHLRCPLRRGR